ncbi:hypothetical protein ACQPXH_07620 [Nocardia sp. CA-135953]|uniref:hypothetical protein n=1 Tax=Nocardia sp. CA-135953 TaxID=3239978 RepID=UPI003D97EC68
MGRDRAADQKAVPTGVYAGGSALMLRLAERDNTIAHWPEGNTGNHVVPMELPDEHVADIGRSSSGRSSARWLERSVVLVRDFVP